MGTVTDVLVGPGYYLVFVGNYVGGVILGLFSGLNLLLSFCEMGLSGGHLVLFIGRTLE